MPTDISGTGIAVAQGTGAPQSLTSIAGGGVAKAVGSGWPQYPPPPHIPPTLQDLWFYGATQVKTPPGLGVAKAVGSGEPLT